MSNMITRNISSHTFWGLTRRSYILFLSTSFLPQSVRDSAPFFEFTFSRRRFSNECIVLLMRNRSREFFGLKRTRTCASPGNARTAIKSPPTASPLRMTSASSPRLYSFNGLTLSGLISIKSIITHFSCLGMRSVLNHFLCFIELTIGEYQGVLIETNRIKRFLATATSFFLFDKFIINIGKKFRRSIHLFCAEDSSDCSV